jgi:hypothetical protein
MKRTFFQRLIASAVVIGAALGTATVAQARPDVFVSIGLPGVPVLLPPPLPRPFIRAEPVYVQPSPVYEAPVVVYERAWRATYRHEAERDQEWRHREWRHREWERREWERRDHEQDRPSHGGHRGRD